MVDRQPDRLKLVQNIGATPIDDSGGDAVQQVLPSVRADLERLVRIPSVSADPTAGPYLRDSAAEVAALLEAAGLPEVDVLTIPGGQPAVHRRIHHEQHPSASSRLQRPGPAGRQ